MALKMPQKPIAQEKSKTAEEFIRKGGGDPLDGDNKRGEIFTMSFRCPADLMNKVDSWRASRPGRIPRNQALVEIISDFFERSLDDTK